MLNKNSKVKWCDAMMRGLLFQKLRIIQNCSRKNSLTTMKSQQLFNSSAKIFAAPWKWAQQTAFISNFM